MVFTSLLRIISIQKLIYLYFNDHGFIWMGFFLDGPYVFFLNLLRDRVKEGALIVFQIIISATPLYWNNYLTYKYETLYSYIKGTKKMNYRLIGKSNCRTKTMNILFISGLSAQQNSCFIFREINSLLKKNSVNDSGH